MIDVYKLKDRIEEYFRYFKTQPTRLQKQLLGMYTDVIDYDFTATRLASESSARYMVQKMRAVPNFTNDYIYRDWLLNTQLCGKGAFLELGVHSGRTINQIARAKPNDTIHGFDSFEGLPEDWTSRMPKGFFHRHGNLPKVRDNVVLHKGWFDKTLPMWKADYGDTPIQFLHIDCDLYSSTVTILNNLKNNIVPGTVIAFDEYINHMTWELDEFKAWQEHVAKHNVDYEYIGRVSRHQKVAIRVIK